MTQDYCALFFQHSYYYLKKEDSSKVQGYFYFALPLDKLTY